MEKDTRDRLTGAVILVALLPIVVTELLSGPDGDKPPAADAVAEEGPPLTTYDLALDSAGGAASARQRELAATTATETEAIAQAVPPPVTEPPRVTLPEPQREAPAPESRAPVAAEPQAREATPEASSRPAQANRAAERAPAAAQPAAPASTGAAPGGRWWVQLGSFSSQENAQRLARDLRGKGFTIEVSPVRSGGRDLHRVRAGPEGDRGRAVALRDRLAAAGQQGTLVAP